MEVLLRVEREENQSKTETIFELESVLEVRVGDLGLGDLGLET